MTTKRTWSLVNNKYDEPNYKDSQYLHSSQTDDRLHDVSLVFIEYKIKLELDKENLVIIENIK